jgi:ribosomal-protein-alanine N-acetyltransferase
MHYPEFITLETKRLFLKKLSLEFCDGLYSLLSDVNVVKFTEDNLVSDLEQVKLFIEKNQALYNDYGFGKWAVIDKQTNKFIGLCGFKYYPSLNKKALSYSFLNQCWGQGFATEASKAALNYAFNGLKNTNVVAWSTPDNFASLKVLEKLGFSFVRNEKWNHTQWNYYEINFNAFNAFF